MASDEIINEIWEVAQENSIDPIDKDEFGKDLRKAVFAELERATEGVISDINNEFARALPIILHQAKANPELIYESNGKGFSVASGILAKAVLTVKYENKFIPGTAEYQKEFPKETLEKVVLTAGVMDAMINKFDTLSFEEREGIINRWGELNREQKRKIINSQKEALSQDPTFSEEEHSEIDEFYRNVEGVNEAQQNLEGRTEDERIQIGAELFDELYEKSEDFRLKYQPLLDKGVPKHTIYFEYYIKNLEDTVQSVVANNNRYIYGFEEYDFIGMRKASDKIQYHKYAVEIIYNRHGIPIPNFDGQVYKNINYYNNVSSFVQQNVGNGVKHDPVELEAIPRVLITIPENPIESPNAKTTIPATKNVGRTSVSNDMAKKITSKNSSLEVIEEMLEVFFEEKIANLFGYELKELLSQKAEEIGLSEDAKKILEAVMASKDDDSFAVLFYDDREGFLQELEKMSLLQHAKKQPVTDQEYGPTYRANAEEMVVDSKGLYKAQTDIRKINEQDGAGTGEGSDASTTGTAVVQNNDTLEVDTINTHQPATNSFINTARREGAEKDGKDLKGEKDGEGLEDVPPENDLPDNAPNNSVKVANVITITKKKKMTTDVIQEMGNITTRVKEDMQQGGPEVGDASETIQPGEIE